MRTRFARGWSLGAEAQRSLDLRRHRERHLHLLRNPWRLTFDPLPPHHLWIGDVGEVTWEEITISRGRGEHHGWPFREGAHGDARTSCPAATPHAGGDCVEPAFEYAHSRRRPRGA